MKKRVFNVLVKLSIIRKDVHITVGAIRVNEVIYINWSQNAALWDSTSDIMPALAGDDNRNVSRQLIQRINSAS